MKKLVLIAILGIIPVAMPATEPSKNREVEKLLSSLSLDEKIGQMVQLDLMTVTRSGSSPIQLDQAKLREALVTYKIGSFINNGVGRALSIDEWKYVNQTIQDMIRTETPHKIPLLYGIDSIHGATYVQGSTLFPQNLAMAAARDPELMRRCAEISALETRAAGLRWTFAPVLDVGRQPLWARFSETFGEDPYLASRLGAATVHGFQGNDVSSPKAVAACMKHYVGYSFPFSGKDRSPALMPDYYLREYFLPPFREAVRAGVKTVMVNSGEVNGIPVHASKYLLTDVLRRELGFNGVIVSDWQDVIRLHTWHGIAESPADAVRLSLEAGLDMSMVPLDYSFFKLLKQLVKEKRVSEKRIDESVRRILELKREVGLLQNPYLEPETAGNFGRPEYRQTALQAAEGAMTLLKNENATLPLAKSARVLVTGPAANSLSALHGCWSYTWQGTDDKQYPAGTPTIVDAIRQKIGEANVRFNRGVDFDGKPIDVEAAVSAAAEVDVVVLCVGEDSYAETPGDINDLNLPVGQQDFAKQLYAAGKPVVLVLVEGRARVLREIEPQANGIVMAYWPGSEGARAIANVLFGDTNPSGKLPFTYPRYSNHLVMYDRNRTARIDEIEPPPGHKASEYTPQWEFGAGLSYTSFRYRDVKLSAPVLKRNERLTVTVEISNSGKLAGNETVELYTRDVCASMTPAGRRLRSFQKIFLEPGQKKWVSVELSAADLAFVNASGKPVTEPGEFEVFVGDQQAKFRFED